MLCALYGMTDIVKNTAIQISFILCYETSALASVHFPTHTRLGVVIQIFYSVEQFLQVSSLDPTFVL